MSKELQKELQIFTREELFLNSFNIGKARECLSLFSNRAVIPTPDDYIGRLTQDDHVKLLHVLDELNESLIFDHLDIIIGIDDLPEFFDFNQYCLDEDRIRQEKKENLKVRIPEMVDNVIRLVEEMLDLNRCELSQTLQDHIVERALFVFEDYFTQQCVGEDVQETQFRILASVLLNICDVL